MYKSYTKASSSVCVGVKKVDGSPTSVSIPPALMKRAALALGGVAAARKMIRTGVLAYNHENAHCSRSAYAQSLLQAAILKFERQLQDKPEVKPVPRTYQKSRKTTSTQKVGVLNLNSRYFQSLTEPVKLAEMNYLGHRVTLEAMPAKVFHSLPECPIQRDTRSRATVVKHLKTASPLHASVVATRVDGKLNKLDGHTRDNCWQVAGTLEAPPGVFCYVIECANYEQVKALYDQADSQAAAERKKEKIWGSWKELGHITASPFFASTGPFISAVVKAFSDMVPAAHPRKLAEASLQCVKLLESAGKGLDLVARPMVVASALIVTRKLIAVGKSSRISEVAEFLERVACREGKQSNNKCDAVQLLLDTFKDENQRGGSSTHQEELGFALSALALWMESSEAAFERHMLQPVSRAHYLGDLEVVRKRGRLAKSASSAAEAEAPAEPVKRAFVGKKVVAPPASAFMKMSATLDNMTAEVAPSLPLPSPLLKRPVLKPSYSR